MASKLCSGLGSFLKSTNRTANHFVLGNEAGDADSIVSALTLAYVDSFRIAKTPVVSINRADLPLRRETELLLKLAGVDPNDLLYVDDLGLCESRCSVTLVDHNRLTNTLKDRFDVVEIMDHHHDLGDHGNVNGEDRIIAFENERALVGSTCTLVAERMIASLEPLYSADLSLLLLGVILLDTINMSPEADKGTTRDQKAIDILLQETDWSTLPNEAGFLVTESDKIDSEKLFKYLRDSKFDGRFWESLSVTDSLRLDYKRFEASPSGIFGASSILLPMSSFTSKENLIESLEQFLLSFNIALLAITSMTMIDNSPRRELIICGMDKQLVDSMASHLLEQDVLDLTEVNTPNMGDNLVLRQFDQGNVKASRKQLAPIMLKFFEE